MKKQLSENWQLWILMATIFLVLSAGARKIAIDLEWSEFNANILFVISFVGGSILYLIFHEIFVKLAEPLFERLFRRMGLNSQSNEDNEPSSDKIVIEYASTREEKIRKQEERAVALESRVVKYIGDSMAHYTTETQLSKLIDVSCEFFNMNLPPDFNPSDAVEVSDELSTTDLMHFGWNIAKPFRKPCSHTALFLKQVFPHTFRNTEVYTIEKKLRLSPMQGNIKINPDVASYGMPVADEVITHQTEKVKVKSQTVISRKSAKHTALADMMDDGLIDTFDLEDSLL